MTEVRLFNMKWLNMNGLIHEWTTRIENFRHKLLMTSGLKMILELAMRKQKLINLPNFSE